MKWFAHLFQGLFQTGDWMLQWKRLREAGTHHLWIGIAAHLVIWIEKMEKREAETTKSTRGQVIMVWVSIPAQRWTVSLNLSCSWFLVDPMKVSNLKMQTFPLWTADEHSCLSPCFTVTCHLCIGVRKMFSLFLWIWADLLSLLYNTHTAWECSFNESNKK